jgi:hypothetical protein
LSRCASAIQIVRALESIERAEAGNESYFQGLPGQVAGSCLLFWSRVKKWPPETERPLCVGNSHLFS